MADATHLRPFRKLFALAVAALAVTGLGQMPVFKRYYVSDVPGLGWTADFVLTHRLHYAAAAVFLFILGYRTANRKLGKRSVPDMILAVLLALTACTGLALAVKNLPGVLFPPALITALNISHPGFAFLLAPAGMAAWLARRNAR